MKQIIRVENTEDGRGMFRSRIDNIGSSPELREMLERYKDKFPTPSQDGLDYTYIDVDEFFAFKSLEQFQQWVLPWEARALISKGFKILLIDIELYREGGNQIVFFKKDILNSKDITQLFI